MFSERRGNEKCVINDNTDNIARQSNPCRATREMKINNIKDTVLCLVNASKAGYCLVNGAKRLLIRV